MKIAVFMGGISIEREVSLMTGEAILESLIKQGYDAYKVDITKDNTISAFVENEYDLAYLALHGKFGEDGLAQGILETIGKKYTGSGVLASAFSMDKILTKKYASSLGIKVPKTYNRIDDIIDYPVIVKPVSEGSSLCLYLCNNEEELKAAIDKIPLSYMIEEYIKGEELTVGVLNGEALGVTRILPKSSAIYDFDSKYKKGASIHECPAKISEKVYRKAMEVSSLIHKEIGLKGISRSDFILKDNEIYFLEVNSCPGCTKTSLVPELINLKGYNFDDLVKIMVETFK